MLLSCLEQRTFQYVPQTGMLISERVDIYTQTFGFLFLLGTTTAQPKKDIIKKT